MLTTILTIWQGLKSKAVIYGILALAILAGLAKVFTAGKTFEKLATVQEQLKETKRNAEISARIDSLSTDAIRDRLRHDWSSN